MISQDGIVWENRCYFLSDFILGLVNMEIASWGKEMVRPCNSSSLWMRLLIFQCLESLKVRSSVQSLSLTLCDLMDCSTPRFPVHHQLPELDQIHVHQVSDAIQPSHPPSSPSPAFCLSQHQGLFQWVSSLQHFWPKFWSFSFSISPSNEYSGLISFRID